MANLVHILTYGSAGLSFQLNLYLQSNPQPMKVTGSFTVIMKPLEAYAKTEDGSTLGRMSIDKKFNVEKELLLALMGIETNFGTYVGKMDILSSLATLSYDKRRICIN